MSATANHTLEVGRCGGLCDGCNRKIPNGEPYLGGIDGCCGGCYRVLCALCAIEGSKLIEQALVEYRKEQKP